jgi:isoleucyl-tRNA synthetase
MSTLEALNAISEAIQAHAKLPEVERTLRQTEENFAYKSLELDEANEKINQLQTLIIGLEAKLEDAEAGLSQKDQTIAELRDRNNMLANSLNDAQNVIRNQEQRIIERELENKSLTLTKESLEARLADAKGYGTKLAETLRSIGASIVAAVEVPEVTSEAPFPVANPVGLPDSPSDQSNTVIDPVTMEPVAEQARENLEPVINAPGCYTSPMPPVKQWWEN